jgi:hypothetical protein
MLAAAAAGADVVDVAIDSKLHRPFILCCLERLSQACLVLPLRLQWVPSVLR